MAAGGSAWRKRTAFVLSWWISHPVVVLLISGLIISGFPSVVQAGDILRGGTASASGRKASDARANAGAQAAELAKTKAADRLARTTKAINDMRALQSSARAAAGASVPNGLATGGLKVLTGANAKWTGASAPVQNGNTVTIKQTESQALLHWETFNVGKQTTLTFNQKAGGDDAGKWIAFNKVFDPSGQPSQILGSIKADGQVYVINQNGIVFGAGSQVNTRTFVASSLPINDNLIENGVLNNPDAQFLFSALSVPAGDDGTPEFMPDAPLRADGKVGDIVVQKGASLLGPISSDGNGGRVMLVGANVQNEGTISTPAGQTILAAGLQVGIQAHSSDDPSLRGLDVWVGDVGNYAGTVTNSGIIRASTGSILIVGKEIRQNGILDSSTAVNLNGRIDLLASYGAVGNPNFDSVSGITKPAFFSQYTGLVLFGENSVTQILPDLLSTKTIPGTKLSENSQINVEGVGIHFGRGSIVLAPSADVTIRAGTWSFKDTDGDRTTLDASGDDQAGLSVQIVSEVQKFLLSTGQVYFDSGSLVDVSGTTSAFIPISQYLIEVQLRGSELADSPLLRNSNLRGADLLVDLRLSGIYGGREWVGTPLGDLTGFANLVERNVAQLTAKGGTITVSAGDSVVVADGATLDVSGGLVTHEGGTVQTSRLIRGRNLVDINEATPDLLYDGVYNGNSTQLSQKWGVSETYKHSLAPMGGYSQKEYVEGAAGGTLSIAAPKVVLAGELKGQTVTGLRQQDAPPAHSSLQLAFTGEKQIDISASSIFFVTHSPNAPSIEVVEGHGGGTAPEFTLVAGVPATLSTAGLGSFQLGTDLFSEEEGGFGNIEISNADGDFTVASGVPVVLPPGGSLVVSAKNISVQENILAPGGSVELTAYSISPFWYEEQSVRGAFNDKPAPSAVAGRGIIELAKGSTIGVGGVWVDDRPTSSQDHLQAIVLDGGSVKLEGYSIHLAQGSLIDASGGVWAESDGDFSYGDGGTISILSGKDPVVSTAVGGELSMEGVLQAYSVETGGALTVQSNLIQIGGSSGSDGALVVQPEFFQRGGFSEYSLVGLGGRDADGAFLPAVRVVEGTIIEPRTTSWLQIPGANIEKILEYFGDTLEAGVAMDSPFAAIRKLGGELFIPQLKPQGVRVAASLSLVGLGFDDPYTENQVEGMGIVRMEAGTRISTDPGATVSLSGDYVAVFGSVYAPGGTIEIEGRSSFRLPSEIALNASFALPTVHIGSSSVLSTAGTTVYLDDPLGWRSGIIYPGGTISVSGNIVAEAGALLDVSGTSAVLDFHPSRLVSSDYVSVPTNSGLNSSPWGRLSQAVRLDSDGGSIQLEGSQMLYSEATLLGRAGGDSALGGTLAVSSGRFYASAVVRTGADINLIVEQSGSASVFGGTGTLTSVLDAVLSSSNPEAMLTAAFAAGHSNSGIGYFSLADFFEGGFDNLDLGFVYNEGAFPLPFGGNVEFRGPISLNARGVIRLAGGGVIQANAPVTITAPYVVVGQEFRAPLNPDDPFEPFQYITLTGAKEPYFFSPTSGPGTLNIQAGLIDVGTLSLMGIGSAALTSSGDIRGNGILSIQGDLTLAADQIYPTTLATFDIFAYDPAGGLGSVSIFSSGSSSLPLSAGGSLRIFASTITQGGVLRAPLGSIALGWDGTDVDTSDADIDSPYNPVVGSTAAVPVAKLVSLDSGSVTSVSAVDPETGEGLLLPFGLSPDGLTWIDPSGEEVTISGLPARGIAIGADSVVMENGSIVDLRGGGDLLAYRWVPGTGGSVDILGSAINDWSSGDEYSSGDLVLYNNQTWSARVDIDPDDFAVVPKPSESRYWTKVAESYAVIPGFDSEFAPYNEFNTGENSGSLEGDPGYYSAGLRVGEQIYLQAGSGLAEGYYTLLPRRYGVMPGAYLIIPSEGNLADTSTVRSSLSPALGDSSFSFGTTQREEGSYYVSGYTFNSFNIAGETSQILSRFEVLPPDVLLGRAEYDLYTADSFIREAATRLNVDEVQDRPTDSASLVIQGNTALSLLGSVLSRSISGGRGATVDLSSFEDVYIIGGSGSAAPGATVVLDTDVLNAWGARSLLIGGVRRETSDGVEVETRTGSLVLDNSGASWGGEDIILVSEGALTLANGSSLVSSHGSGTAADSLIVNGDGVLVRVSGDRNASAERDGWTGSTTPILTIGAGVSLGGGTVILDSSHATDMDLSTSITADSLVFGSGQISIVLEPQAGVLAGQVVDPHLILEGNLITQAQKASQLTLSSYRTIDFYGEGTFGGGAMEKLELLGGGVRGFDGGSAGVNILARDVLLANPSDRSSLSEPTGGASGVFSITSQTVRLGANDFFLRGYAETQITASAGVLAEADGSLISVGALVLTAPLVTGAQGIDYSLSFAGAMTLASSGGPSVYSGGLGASLSFEAASINVATKILLPSGGLALRATSGDLTVSGQLSVAGSAHQFYDITKYADAGNIELASSAGDIFLLAGSLVSVAADSGGGNAGTLVVKSPGGLFDNDGTLEGLGGSGGTNGSFVLDAAAISSYDDLTLDLDGASFNESRSLRIRTGDVEVTGTTKVRSFSLSTDAGSILVTGTIDASDEIGGSIELAAANNLTLAATASLTVAAEHFSNAGKGGSITLEAGTAVNGVANTGALLDLQAGSSIDLSVDDYVAGDYLASGSSAFYGQFEGTLHLRAPRLGNDVRVDAIDSTITGGSSIIVEAFRVYQPTNGTMNIALRNTMDADNKAFIDAGESAIRTKVLGTLNTALDPILVVAPGVEIINPTGDLTLGLANNSASGSTNAEALTGADWDLSKYRYGSRNAPGFLTLRAQGDVIINNTLSDGFNAVSVTADNGHSSMWLATLMTINPNLPTNTQSWSYRLTAGADFSAAGFRAVLPTSDLLTDSSGNKRGSVLVGEFYADPVPNEATSGSAAAIDSSGQTADTIRISTTSTNRGTRYEVVRTGTGSIDISAGRDVQLRNAFSTVYTAGVGFADRTRIFETGDFSLPTTFKDSISQGSLGANQQNYQAYYAMAGGNLNVSAQNNIGRFTLVNGEIVADSSRQIPTNWLYRRGLVNSETGLFESGVIKGTSSLGDVNDLSTSTTWWIDYSNFFQGFGALGGGDIALVADENIINADAVIPTNARMAGIDPTSGKNLAPDANNLLEHGGGDLLVAAGNNIDGGNFYVERGNGVLHADNDITTNYAQSPSRGILATTGNSEKILDSLTWQAVTLYGGRTRFDVTARGDILLGPTTSAFLLPQGLNNKFWYKTQFQTIASDSEVNVTSFGGGVTHRLAVTLPGQSNAISTLMAAYLQTSPTSSDSAAYYRPWLRLAETQLQNFNTVATVALPTLRSTAFAGDVTVVGKLNLFPSPTGNVELLASEGIVGLGESGVTTTTAGVSTVTVTAWTSASINLSDADPLAIPTIDSPLGFQQLVGSKLLGTVRDSFEDPFGSVSPLFAETGSYTGANANLEVKSALHAATPVHTGDANPLRLYAGAGDISGLTLFSPKMLQAYAGQDITDIAFYLQHLSEDDISIVSAGRDIVLFNENSPLRALAGDLSQGNLIVDGSQNTVRVDASNKPIQTQALPGDLQIGGLGTLEVLAGRNIDLGSGANFTDGTGIGITSIGRSRNPFLPFFGADFVIMAGVGGEQGGPALGLAESSLSFDSLSGGNLSAEHQALEALGNFFALLKEVGADAVVSGDYSGGYAAIETLFGSSSGQGGGLFTQARDIRTSSGGSISIAAPGGGVTMASDIFGNPLTPPGIVTEYGGEVSILTDGNVDIGQARIFTLRGGDLTIWSSHGDIAAGKASRTVVTAPPTRVLIDVNSADVVTDLGGLATGGGIGVLAAVEEVEEGEVSLIAPEGTVDAGDAGIRATGGVTIAAAAVKNADNISAGGKTAGIPTTPTVAAPNIGGLTSGSSTSAAASSAANQVSQQARPQAQTQEDVPSIIAVEVLGYGGGEEESEG